MISSLELRAWSAISWASPAFVSRAGALAGALAAILSGCAGTTPPVSTPPVTSAVSPGLAPAGASVTRAGGAEYDVVIRNGRVLDGMGNPWILADVAIRDGKFVRIGRVTGRGAREIDARGLYVSPGWIDMMDQSGGVLPVNGLAENKIRQGVTTAVGGEGGFPVSASGIGAYFAQLERQGISINFGNYHSSTDELIELAKVAAKYGGIYASHIRGEGREVVESVRELIRIAEEGGLPGEVFHLKVGYKPGWGVLMDSVRQVIEAARARNVDVAADLYVYTAGGTGLEATIPAWAADGGRDSLLKRLADPAIRARLKREVQTGSPGWWNIIEAAGGWEGVVLVNAQNPANARYQQKSIAQIAREMGKEPADAAWDLVAQGSGRVMAIYHMMSEQDIEAALRMPWTSIGSDAGAALNFGQLDQTGLPHPRSYGNAVRVISRYVRDRKVLTLEDGIRKQTSWPATRMRLANRGAVKEGNWADVTIFDLATLDDRATYDNPLVAPTGIRYVLVNGAVTLEGGQHTQARAGRVLHGPGRER